MRMVKIGLILSLGLTPVACNLTQEQEQRIQLLQDELAESFAQVQALTARITILYGHAEEAAKALVEVGKALKEGRIPAAEGAELIALYTSRRSEVENEIKALEQNVVDLRLSAEATKDALKDAQDSGASIWAILGSLLGNALLGGGLVRSKITEARHRKFSVASIRGIESLSADMKPDDLAVVKAKLREAHDNADVEAFAEKLVAKITKRRAA